MGLQVLEPGWITARQIEAGRIAMTRAVKRGGKIWIRIFPDKPYTKKPAETRMGKGKGAPEGWVAVVKPGRILYEMEGVDLADGQGGAEARGRQARPQDALRHRASRRWRSDEEEGAGDARPAGRRRLLENEKAAAGAAWKLRLQKSTGQLENPSRLRVVRRDIARVKTYRRALERKAERPK